MIYACCDPRRRDTIAGQSTYNGIDFLEVVDNPGDPDSLRQRTLLVHFILPLTAGQFGLANVVIEGGERIRGIRIVSVEEEGFLSPAGDPRVLVVKVERPGDFSTYTLRLVDTALSPPLPTNIDPVLSRVEFSFKAACPSVFDCKPQQACPDVPAKPVDVSYLAKDYQSFRQLMLDRIAKILPAYRETSPADIGIMLVELLAYLGDYLSYQQDAVATEAYLGTARRRTSVRRHVRLVDYPMHDGRNARTWIHFDAARGIQGLVLAYQPEAPTTRLLTRTGAPEGILANPSPEYTNALLERPQVFELMEPLTLFYRHNEMSFYTWGARDCCLSAGSTRAWLDGAFPDLQNGDVLIFQEALGPLTGVPEDADPRHRHPVRLTNVEVTADPLGGRFDEPPTNSATPITLIEWAEEDALPFPLCVSSTSDTEVFDDVSVALGNNALADHGGTIIDEPLPPAPAPNPALTPAAPAESNHCSRQPSDPAPARFRPLLRKAPLTFADAYDSSQPAASALSSRALDTLLPRVTLAEPGEPVRWQPANDLLRGHADTREFVAEVENDGSASLRFGDGIQGRRPAPGTQFAATYRTGNGSSGNIGADSIAHVATSDPALISDPTGLPIVRVTNPIPAAGGLDPETLDEVRQRAPFAFRVQERAVTAQDYADIAQRIQPSLQRAQAAFRWTGSWRTVFIAVDRKGTAQVDEEFEEKLEAGMERYRMAGHDVDVEAPVFVSLDIELAICVKLDYLRSDVERALYEQFSNRALPDGTLGAFHPDNFTFGQTVYLSPLIARAQRTPGVESVKAVKFQRQGIDSTKGLDDEKLDMARMEIARLDNDPNFPEHGAFKLTTEGGR